MADFIHFHFEDAYNVYSSSDDQNDNSKVSSFIDNTNYDENLSDYYGFLNVSRSAESAEEDALSESNVRQVNNENVEAENYCLNSDEEVSDNEDNFANSKEIIEDFIKSLKIPHEEENFDSLLYAIFYSIRLERT